MVRGREKKRVEESRSEKRRSQKKENADARKGRKVAKHSASRLSYLFTHLDLLSSEAFSFFCSSLL
jgi:hypothetical protein